MPGHYDKPAKPPAFKSKNNPNYDKLPWKTKMRFDQMAEEAYRQRVNDDEKPRK